MKIHYKCIGKRYITWEILFVGTFLSSVVKSHLGEQGGAQVISKGGVTEQCPESIHVNEQMLKVPQWISYGN